MRRGSKILLAGCALAGLGEAVVAPIEWAWPSDWGGRVHWHGDSRSRNVALTFDDGPSRYTPAVLDILAEHDVPATFFVIGEHAAARPAVIERMAREGHAIGNHTWSHRPSTLRLVAHAPHDEIARTQNVVESLTGEVPIWFRTPSAQLGRNLWNAVRARELEVVHGTLPIAPAGGDADRQLAVLERTLEPGAILVLHDGDDASADSRRPAAVVEALPRLLELLDTNGYEAVSLGELLDEAPARPGR